MWWQLPATRVNIIVAFATQYYQILWYIGSSGYMFLDVMKFENPWICSTPLVTIPSVQSARAPVSLVHLPLNIKGDISIMWF